MWVTRETRSRPWITRGGEYSTCAGVDLQTEDVRTLGGAKGLKRPATARVEPLHMETQSGNHGAV